jgi:hypothetical protein
MAKNNHTSMEKPKPAILFLNNRAIKMDIPEKEIVNNKPDMSRIVKSQIWGDTNNP